MRRLSLVLLLSLVSVAASAKNMYIPVAGKTAGANGTSWRTDVRIFNPSPTTTIHVTLHFLPQGMDGRNIPGRVVTIGPREMTVLDDVVAFLAPELAPVIGAIRIDSDTDRSYEFVASSRTWTPSPGATTPGSYGQFVPALAPEEAATDTVVLHVTHVPQFRANFGAMNPGQTETLVRTKLYSNDGLYPPIDGTPFVVPARSMRQMTLEGLFGGVYLPDGYVVFTSTAPVLTWGSIVDNFTGDGFTVLGRPDVEAGPSAAQP